MFLKINDAELDLTAPREPCFKFNAIMGDRLAGKKMFFKDYVDGIFQ